MVYDDALAIAENRIRALLEKFEDEHELTLGLATRVKTTSTIREKLQREHGMGLKGMADIAGVRISGPMTRLQQDALGARVMREFEDDLRPPRKVDRRAVPSAGYRALHVVVHVDGLPVEVQLRTALQDAWAQIVEKLGDVWGRDIRYGQLPESPDAPVGDGSLTRTDVLQALMKFSSDIDEMEELQAQQVLEEEELEELHAEVGQMYVSDPGLADILGRVQQLKDDLLDRRTRQDAWLTDMRQFLDSLLGSVEGWT